MEFTKITLVVLVTASFTYGQLPVMDLCANCTIINGAAYNSHPTDCDKFVQCHSDHFGRLVGDIQKCAFATYWNMNKLTCLPYDETPCKSDRCEGLADQTVFAADSNCRGYWECVGEQAIPKCCPFGYRYDVASGCIEDKEETCEDRCFNEKTKKKACDKRPIVGNPNAFEQYLEGWGYIPMPCAPGTIYNEKDCECTDQTKFIFEAKKCTPEVYLPFDKNTDDMSGNNFFVGNENDKVRVYKGVAKFYGDGRLIIPRFTNLEHSTTVVINVKYTSSALTPSVPRAIVSNSDCGNLPSIMISEDSDSIRFGVGTSTTDFEFTSIPRQLDGSKTVLSQELTYMFDKGVLTGTNGVNTTSIKVPGTLRNVQCALHVGDADNLNSFIGTIDELTVYLCKPPMP